MMLSGVTVGLSGVIGAFVDMFYLALPYRVFRRHARRNRGFVNPQFEIRSPKFDGDSIRVRSEGLGWAGLLPSRENEIGTKGARAELLPSAECANGISPAMKNLAQAPKGRKLVATPVRAWIKYAE